MKLRGIEFGTCLDASGVRGFFGCGYWFHHLPLLSHWYNFAGSIFVAKSTKSARTEGNMPLTDDYEPRELFPKCIWVNFFRGISLNAVGLGGPGADEILWEGIDNGRWNRQRPFMISFAPEGDNPEERIADVKRFADILKGHIERHPWLLKILGLQVNVSCPNTHMSPRILAGEARNYLGVLQELNIVIGIKINLLVPVDVVKQIAEHPACDFICLSNTVPFGQLPDRIPWDKWFPNGSPLAQFNGGGLSGKPLLPLLIERLQEIRKAGIEIPLNAGGGILSEKDAAMVIKQGNLRRGIDSLFIGSIAMLRPWNIRSVIFMSKCL